MKRTKFEIGDRVKYSVKFLRSTGNHTGEIPFARGKITKLSDYGDSFVIATIKWDRPLYGDTEGKVNTFNLVKEKQLEAD